MERLLSPAALSLTAVGVFLSGLLGKEEGWLYALLIMMLLDYVSGVVKAIYHRRLSSSIGFKGIMRKAAILLCVAVGALAEALTHIPLKRLIICFYLSNEGISLLENLAEMIPVPKPVRDILLQLRTDAEKTGEEKRKK